MTTQTEKLNKYIQVLKKHLEEKEAVEKNSQSRGIIEGPSQLLGTAQASCG